VEYKKEIGMEAVEQTAETNADKGQAAGFEPDIIAFCCEH